MFTRRACARLFPDKETVSSDDIIVSFNVYLDIERVARYLSDNKACGFPRAYAPNTPRNSRDLFYFVSMSASRLRGELATRPAQEITSRTSRK